MRYVVVLETLRLGAAIPSVPRKILNDVEFNGYVQPKGTLVFAKYHGMNYDKALWDEDAEVFHPERYLNSSPAFLIPALENEPILAVY